MIQDEQAKLDKVEAKVQALEVLASLKNMLDEKNVESAKIDGKIKCVIDLVASFNETFASVVAHSLLASSFVSYAGSSSRAFRERHVHDIWKPFGLLYNDDLIPSCVHNFN